MSDEEDDRRVMIVGREQEVPEPFRAPGTGLIVADCGCVCLISPSGQKFYEEQGDIVTSCMQCTGKSAEELREQVLKQGNQVMAPGSKAEMQSSPLLRALWKAVDFEEIEEAE